MRAFVLGGGGSYRAGDGCVGLPGEHSQRADSFYLALRRVPKDPPAPAPEENDAEAYLQEVGGGLASVDVRRGRGSVYRE